jgi:hypothetical protein
MNYKERKINPFSRLMKIELFGFNQLKKAAPKGAAF